LGGERYSRMNFEVILTETVSLTDNVSIITANIVDVLAVISFHVGIIIGN
jgi:hypothetical protein